MVIWLISYTNVILYSITIAGLLICGMLWSTKNSLITNLTFLFIMLVLHQDMLGINARAVFIVLIFWFMMKSINLLLILSMFCFCWGSSVGKVWIKWETSNTARKKLYVKVSQKRTHLLETLSIKNRARTPSANRNCCILN